MKSYVEHANITVSHFDKTVAFLLAAIPTWRVRGGSVNNDWHGKVVQWQHIGDDESYIAVQGGGEDRARNWNEPWVGVKHIGIVVPAVIPHPIWELK